jgi:hypothetical protein
MRQLQLVTIWSGCAALLDPTPRHAVSDFAQQPRTGHRCAPVPFVNLPQVFQFGAIPPTVPKTFSHISWKRDVHSGVVHSINKPLPKKKSTRQTITLRPSATNHPLSGAQRGVLSPPRRLLPPHRCTIGMACAQAAALRGAPTTARRHIAAPRNLLPLHMVADGNATR